MKKIIIAFCFITAFIGGFGLMFFNDSHSEAAYTREYKELKKAIWSERIGKVKAIHRRGESLSANVRDETGTPLLFYAATRDIASFLVENFEGDPFLVSGEGENILHYVVRRIPGVNPRMVSAFKYYLRLGVDPNQPWKEGLTVSRLMEKKTCKGELFPWDRETILLVESPGSNLLAHQADGITHTFKTPIVKMKVPKNSHFKPSWAGGGTFTAYEKKVNGDRLVLTYRGYFSNPTVYTRLEPTYDYDSCKKVDGAWQCNDKETGELTVFPSPSITLVSEVQYMKEHGTVFQSTPNHKNLQPDGEIILGCKLDFPDDLEVTCEYPNEYDFESVRMYYGDWVCVE